MQQFTAAVIGIVAVAAAAAYVGAIATQKIAVRRSGNKQANQEEEQEQQNGGKGSGTGRRGKRVTGRACQRATHGYEDSAG